MFVNGNCKFSGFSSGIIAPRISYHYERRDAYVSAIISDIWRYKGTFLVLVPGGASVASGQGGMINNSFASNAINGGATLVDGAVIASELSPPRMLARSAFNNVKASAAAGKLIAKGNVLLTWTAVTAGGIDIYNNRAKATNADYTKWGVDVGLAAAGTGLVVASFIPGVNVAVWTGVALFGASTANTYGLFDPLYLKLNK